MMADPPIRGKGLAYAKDIDRARGLILALVAVPAARPAEPAAASLGPAYRDAHLGLQTGAVVVMSSGDISPPTNETKVDDHATREIILAAHPDLVLTLGDNQYETGSGAMFHSAIGFDGSWGRIKGLIRPAEGNHDAADPGPGSPGFQEYFADNLANLECTRLNPPCRPDLGYSDFDLPNAKLIIAFAAGVLATLLVWLLVSVLPHRAGQPTPTARPSCWPRRPARPRRRSAPRHCQPLPCRPAGDPAPSPPPALPGSFR